MPPKINCVKLLDAVTATGAGEIHQPTTSKSTFHAVGSTSAGAGAATIDIEVSNDDAEPKNFLVSATITLTLAVTESGDGFVSSAAWKHVRANVTSISGTNATVRCFIANSGGE